MFRSSTILSELVQTLYKVTLLLKHSVKLRHCIVCGDVAACREIACVLFVVQTAVTDGSCHTIMHIIPEAIVSYFTYCSAPRPRRVRSVTEDRA